MFEKIPAGKPKQARFTKAQQKAMAEAVPIEEEEAEGSSHFFPPSHSISPPI